jgi:hypothetical protein
MERKTGFEPATLTLAKKGEGFLPIGSGGSPMCGSVQPVSSPSTQFAAVVERSTIPQPGECIRFQDGSFVSLTSWSTDGRTTSCRFTLMR